MMTKTGRVPAVGGSRRRMTRTSVRAVPRAASSAMTTTMTIGRGVPGAATGMISFRNQYLNTLTKTANEPPGCGPAVRHPIGIPIVLQGAHCRRAAARRLLVPRHL